MSWLILIFCVIFMAVIIKMARPSNIWEDPQPGTFVVINRLTGNVALMGRQFRTPEKAAMAVERMLNRDRLTVLYDMYEIREVA